MQAAYRPDMFAKTIVSGMMGENPGIFSGKKRPQSFVPAGGTFKAPPGDQLPNRAVHILKIKKGWRENFRQPSSVACKLQGWKARD